jgi:hypothetical protein
MEQNLQFLSIPAREERVTNVFIGIVNLMRMAELAPPDLKRRGHLERGRSTIVRKTHQRKNH